MICLSIDPRGHNHWFDMLQWPGGLSVSLSYVSRVAVRVYMPWCPCAVVCPSVRGVDVWQQLLATQYLSVQGCSSHCVAHTSVCELYTVSQTEIAVVIIIIISCIYNAPNDGLSANGIHILYIP